VDAPVQPVGHGDCGDTASAGAAAKAKASAETGTTATLPTSDCHSGTGGDCGDSPQCRQACMHASVAVAPLLSVGILQPRVDAVLHRLVAGHPAPMLPSTFRPPIA